MHRSLGNSKGMTMIELLVSIAILSIITIPISSYFVSSIKINKDAEYRLKANQLAQLTMEDIKSQKTVAQTVYEGVKTIEGDYEITKIILPVTQYSIATNNNNNQAIAIDNDSSIDITSGEMKFDGSNTISATNNSKIDVKVELTGGNSYLITYGNLSKTLMKASGSNSGINILIRQSSSNNINFDVSSIGVKTNIYIMKSKDASGTVLVNTKAGTVKVYDNIYDNTVVGTDISWVYRVTIIVKRSGKELVRISGLKKVD